VAERVTFTLLMERLIQELQRRVRGGELTERGLARLLDASQPHIHNLLKGVRGMSPDLADHILERLNIPIESLFTEEELHRLGTAACKPPLNPPGVNKT
jgi:transcriptional regulator with XRE-family HTH domain